MDDQTRRSVIASIREPTPAMITASRQALGKYIRALPAAEREKVVGKAGGFRVYDESLKARIRYQAMIDVLLTPGPEL